MSALQLVMFNLENNTYMASAIQLSAFLQIFNFTLVAQMWVLTDKDEELSESQQKFDFWIFAEACLIISTLCANIIFLLIRSCFKNHLVFEVEPPNMQKDFIETKEFQAMLILFYYCCFPLVFIAMLKWIYFDYRVYTPTDEVSWLLNIQLILSIVQAAMAITLIFIPMVLKENIGYNHIGPWLHFAAIHVYSVLVPAVYIIYYVYLCFTSTILFGPIMFEDDPYNLMRPWFFCYALMSGVAMPITYYGLFYDLIKGLGG